MPALTVGEAAATTGWSPRMLRYLDERGLVSPARSRGGYRLFAAPQLQRLRTLRTLLERFGLTPADVALVARLRRDQTLRGAVELWLDSPAAAPAGHATPEAWLAFEQRKHQELLGLVPPPTSQECA